MDYTILGAKALLGILGVIIFAVWKVREHLSEFDVSRLVRENKGFWIWSVTMVALVLAVITISPDTADALRTMVGLDVSGEPGSFLLLGWSLSALANNINKKKLQTKK